MSLRRFNNLTQESQRIIIKSFIETDSCFGVPCDKCPLQHDKQDETRWTIKRLCEKSGNVRIELISVLGSHYLFDILIDLPHNIQDKTRG